MERKKPASSILTLKDSVSIEQATSLKAELLDFIKENEKIYIDLSQVTDIDTSILQLILSASQEATNSKKQLFVMGPFQDSVKGLLTKLSIPLPEDKSEVANA